MNIRPFDVSSGIQSVLEMPTSGSLPGARPLAVQGLNEANPESLFVPAAMSRLVESALCPNVGDGDITRPEIFNALLRDAVQHFDTMKHPDIQAFLDEDLRPLMENHYLQQAYLGLLVGA